MRRPLPEAGIPGLDLEEAGGHDVPRRTFLRSCLAIPAAVAAGCQQAEPAYPGRETRVIVHASPGGISDTVARYTARGLNEQFGMPVICENRVGAMGAVAFAAVRAAEPDGYTVGYTPVEFSIIPHLRYTPISFDDYDLLARHHRAPAALAVPASSPYTSLDGFITAMRAGDRLALGSAGPASVWHIAGLALARTLGRTFVYAPFPGSGPTVTALLGHHLDAVIAAVAEVQAVVRAGAVRLLGVMGDERSSIFPDVPTFRERGLDLHFEAWGGFMTPRGVPADRLARLERSILTAFQAPAFLAYCRTAGIDVAILDADAFRRFVAAESDRFARIVREEGLVPA